MKHFAFSFVCIVLLLCSCRPNASKNMITEEMAYEGVNSYCHNAYDWSVVEDNRQVSDSLGEREEGEADSPMMYVTMGEETDSTYQVVFRSYTGAFVYFYVDKASGVTKMVESVPALDIEEEKGTINLFDYLEKKN